MSAPVIVFTGPQGEAGRTTLLTHIAVGLINQGLTPGLVELNGPGGGLIRWVSRRRRLVAQGGDFPLPDMVEVVLSGAAEDQLDLNMRAWPAVLQATAARADVVLVDAPLAPSPLAEVALLDASEVVTVTGPTSADLDALFAPSFDGVAKRPGPHAQAIWSARRTQARRGRRTAAWRLVRMKTEDQPADVDAELTLARAERFLGLRMAGILSQASVIAGAMPMGLTALDRGLFTPECASEIDGVLDALHLASPAVEPLAGSALSA